LPAYAPELNPVEKVWSHLKRSLANLAAGNATNLSRLAKTKLRKMQYVDGLIDGFFRATGLSSPSSPDPDSSVNRPGFGTGPTSCGGSSHVTPFPVPG
jgi:hypothetical protein